MYTPDIAAFFLSVFAAIVVGYLFYCRLSERHARRVWEAYHDWVTRRSACL